MRHLLRPCIVSLALLGAVACGPDSTSTQQSALLEGQSDALTAAAAKGSDKVVVCHIPPGNPANAHTISIGAPAVDAHLAHGDRVGECDAPPEDDGGSTPDGGEGPVDGGDTGGGKCQAAEMACSDLAHCCAGLACGEEGRCVTVIN